MCGICATRALCSRVGGTRKFSSRALLVMAATSRLPASLKKRLTSTFTTTTTTTKPPPSKSHLHKPIPSESFPSGYILTGIHAGIKKNASALDLAVILSTSPRPTSAAACFTRNAFKAAPVLVSEEVLRAGGGRARGVVVNSGCANAVTGARGLENAWKMVKATDELLPPGVAAAAAGGGGEGGASETLVMSTGVIGQHVPIASILSALASLKPAGDTLSSAFSAWENVARAFMTTDTFPKLRAREFRVGGRTYRLAGVDKGAGMIHPSMGPARGTAESGFASAHRGGGGPPLHATLLACVMTDAPVSPRGLQAALTYAVERSFNSISVDGDMSTNDTIIALANGAGAVDVPEIDEGDGEAFRVFRDELTAFTQDLAQLVVRDGEGATKFVKITVKGAPGYDNAHAVASKISTSALVKTALYGEDAKYRNFYLHTHTHETHYYYAAGAAFSLPLDRCR